MKIGVKINQNENLEELVQTAKPILDAMFTRACRTKIEAQVNGNEVYVEIPEPNGKSLAITKQLDSLLYKPLVNNGLSGQGYDFIFGEEEMKDLWGWYSIAKIREHEGDIAGYRKMMGEYAERVNRYPRFNKPNN